MHGPSPEAFDSREVVGIARAHDHFLCGRDCYHSAAAGTPGQRDNLCPFADTLPSIPASSRRVHLAVCRREAEEKYRKLAETLDAEVRARTRDLEERNTEILRQSEQLRQLSSRLLREQDEVRRHIASEFHDRAGQTLTV